MNKMLDQLNGKTSAGISDIPVKIIKAISPVILAFLADLFNDCIKLGFFLMSFNSQ